MLVIRRRAGESILIGDGVEIEILEIGSTQVKLGIRAPQNVVVLRKEIQITSEENLAASKEKSGAAVNSLLRKLKKAPGAPMSVL